MNIAEQIKRAWIPILSAILLTVAVTAKFHLGAFQEFLVGFIIGALIFAIYDRWID